MAYSRLLSTVFIIDGLISVGCGLVSWLAPGATFATLVDLSSAENESLTLATLASLAFFYVLIGLVCCAAVLRSTFPDQTTAPKLINYNKAFSQKLLTSGG